MTEAERAEYWGTLTASLWEATQRSSPSITRDEIAKLCEQTFRAFYMQLWLDLPEDAIKAIRQANESEVARMMADADALTSEPRFLKD